MEYNNREFLCEFDIECERECVRVTSYMMYEYVN